jgi:hypothetical protein
MNSSPEGRRLLRTKEEAAMQFVVWIETVIAGKSVAVHRVAAVERNGVNAPAELGLTLEDGKTILNGIEQDIIQTQVDLRSGVRAFVAKRSASEGCWISG